MIKSDGSKRVAPSHSAKFSLIDSKLARLACLATLAMSNCCLLNISPTIAQESATSETTEENRSSPLRYVVRFDRHKQHYVDIELSLDVQGRESVELLMATWTPGSYLIREYSRQIDTFSAVDEEGASLQFERTAKNRWLIPCEGKERITVRYDLYCREMSVRTNFVDSEFAVLNGAATFITQADRMDAAHEITIELPEGWQRAVTPLPNLENGKGNQFRARDFDHVVDSPILVGNPSVYPFNVNGIEHYLVNLGDDQAWNGAQAAVDVEKIVAEHQRMWGTVPYSRYMFLNVLGESGGGLEHDESTLMLASRWTYHRSSSYRQWLGLVSHEFFHAWNIRTLRPKVLVNYDYESENYFKSLWIAEGVTSYYDTLALVRSGIISESDYIARLSRSISGVQATPGRLIQSLADSSHDAWIKFYRSDEMTRNTEISYYTKGSVVAFLLDMKVRELTDGEKSLDDVMREFYATHSGDVGYEEEEFRALVSEMVGEDMTDWFASAIDSTDELDYAPALEYLGLQIPAVEAAQRVNDGEGNADDSESKGNSTVQSGGESSGTSSGGGTAWFGANAGDGNIVSSVTINSPAYKAGINVDDELIAFGDVRLRGSGYSRALGLYDIGDTIDVLIARRGRLMRIPVTLEASESSNWRLSKSREASDEQKARLADWLKQDLPEEKSDEETSESQASELEGEGSPSNRQQNGRRGRRGRDGKRQGSDREEASGGSAKKAIDDSDKSPNDESKDSTSD